MRRDAATFVSGCKFKISHIIYIALEMHLWYTEIMQFIVVFSQGNGGKPDEKNDTKNACGRIVLCAVYRMWRGAKN